jgi:2-oxo-4-hydroxy-4-carboxy-5-ureidoimidazoline decarboxylase
MIGKLEQWNALSTEEAARDILPCCGSRAWAQAMAARRPIATPELLVEASREVWNGLPEEEWMEAFASHPRIGASGPAAGATARAREWSAQEQRQVAEGEAALKAALAEGNREYERRFGRIFIVCATGKSPQEILHILQRRLQNNEAAELLASAAEQQEITQIRLRKWLGT